MPEPRKTERWVFTYHELEHPENCRGDDLFMTASEAGNDFVSTHRADTRLEPAGMFKNVYVGSNLPQNENDEQAYERRSVFVGDDGKFAGFEV